MKLALSLGAYISSLICFAQPTVTYSLTATISGSVTGSDGTAVAGLISAVRVYDGASLPKNAIKTATVAISSDGAFKFMGLVGGSYQICVQTPGSWIDPCLWRTSPIPQVSVTGGQQLSNVSVVLQKGALVTVRVNDPSQLLAAISGQPSPSLLVGVSTGSFAFRQALTSEQDSTGRTYNVLIPFDLSTSISAASPTLKLSDVTGQPLASSANSVSILVPSGQQPPTVTLTIAGLTVTAK